MLKFVIKRGDTSPALRFALLPGSVSLAGATVRFQMRPRGGATMIDRAAEILTVFKPAVVAHRQMLDAASRRPRSRADLVERLRGGEF